MKLRAIKLPKTRKFACSGSAVKQAFAGSSLTWAGLGWPSKGFSFDSRCHHRPTLRGPVAASITVNRDRESWLIIYPLDGQLYPAAAADEFVERILPTLRSWLDAQVDKPDTAILGYEEIVVEWLGSNHELHRLRYL